MMRAGFEEMRRRKSRFNALFGTGTIVLVAVTAVGFRWLPVPATVPLVPLQLGLGAVAVLLLFLARRGYRCVDCESPVWPPRALACPRCGAPLSEETPPPQRGPATDTGLDVFARIDRYEHVAARVMIAVAVVAAVVIGVVSADLATATIGAAAIGLVGWFFLVHAPTKVLRAFFWISRAKCGHCGVRFAAELPGVYVIPAHCAGCGTAIATSSPTATEGTART